MDGISQLRFVLPLWLLAASPAAARTPEEPAIVSRQELAIERQRPGPDPGFKLALAYFHDGGWSAAETEAAARESARILAQCGVAMRGATIFNWSSACLVRTSAQCGVAMRGATTYLLRAPEPYRYFHTPRSRELARALPLPRPAVYFVRGTRQRPAFDAEAVGRGNSGTRPELADTVWIAHGARDAGVALAHELAHVLMDSGEHSTEPGNLMREETAPESTRLTAAQCARLRSTGSANGLLR